MLHFGMEGLAPFVMYYSGVVCFFLAIFWRPDIGLYYLVPLIPVQTVRYWRSGTIISSSVFRLFIRDPSLVQSALGMRFFPVLFIIISKPMILTKLFAKRWFMRPIRLARPAQPMDFSALKNSMRGSCGLPCKKLIEDDLK